MAISLAYLYFYYKSLFPKSEGTHGNIHNQSDLDLNTCFENMNLFQYN